jgi:hypothetical protein
LRSDVIYTLFLSFCYCYDVTIYTYSMYILFRSAIIRGYMCHLSGMFKYICFRSRSFYIDGMYSLLYLLVIPFFFGHFLVRSFIFFVKIYIYPLIEIVKSLYIALRTTITGLCITFFQGYSTMILNRIPYELYIR